MATIDYKEKYEQAMERARQFFDKPYLEDSAGIVGYIFPELAESEDENIRKDIVTYLKSILSNKKYGDKFIESWIAWLERQGEKGTNGNEREIPISEQNLTGKVEPKFKVGNKIKLAKEPKYPAREIIAIRNDAYYFDERVYLPFSRQDEWELVGQKPWSEEDEKKLSDVLAILRGGENCYYNSPILIDWLKSLRPQSQWKPSDEQIKAVRLARSFVVDDFDEHPTLSEILMELEEQLLKIREE